MAIKVLNGLFHAHERISYRRLMAFAAASGLLYVGKLDPESWVYVCIAFIAGEAAPKMAAALKGG
jgi:preprotein translocase subunit Sec61beta